jgi:hypothetical protein
LSVFYQEVFTQKKKKRKQKETSDFKVRVFTRKKIELNERMLNNRSIGQQECVVNEF